MFKALRNITGANMMEYVIPVAVVGVVMGMGVYTMADSGVLQKFFAASSGGKLDNKGTLILKSNNYTAPGTQGYNLGTLAKQNSIKLNTSGSLNDLVNSIQSPLASTSSSSASSTFVETSGSAGNVNQIGTMISMVANKVQNEASANSNDPTLQQMSTLLQQISSKTVYNSGLAETQKQLENHVNSSSGSGTNYGNYYGYSSYQSGGAAVTAITNYMNSLTPYTNQMNTQLDEINNLNKQFQDLAATDSKYKPLADKITTLITDVNSINSNLSSQAQAITVESNANSFSINGIQNTNSQQTNSKGENIGNQSPST